MSTDAMTNSGRAVLALLSAIAMLGLACPPQVCAQTSVNSVASVAELVNAINAAPEGATIHVAPGTYELSAALHLKSGTSLVGAGPKKTILTHSSRWKVSTDALPDPEMKLKGLDSEAYLIRVQNKSNDVSVSNLTLRGPNVHGAVFSFQSEGLYLHHLRIEDTMWCGIRTFAMNGAKIHDCEFIDAGGKWKRGGKPGTDGGISGGAIFGVWMKDSQIANNRFTNTKSGKENNFFGIKGRQAKRCRIHHNTIEVGFSIELPFENDEDVEIDHNYCTGAISIPKHAGGSVPASGRTFHIHHNVVTSGYAIEFVRNGVEIDHNLFAFDTEKDGGNLISGFGKAGADGPASFHHNLVNNVGRGVIWTNPTYNHLDVFNNHVIARTTVTPRKEGLFGFNSKNDFTTIKIRNNIIECIGLPRPLFRNDESYGARVENNRLINVLNSERLKNLTTSETIGLAEPLVFKCGMNGEWNVNQWDIRRSN